MTGMKNFSLLIPISVKEKKYKSTSQRLLMNCFFNALMHLVLSSDMTWRGITNEYFMRASGNNLFVG